MLTILVLVTVGYVLWYTPLFGVRSVEVVGAQAVSADQIRAAAAVPDGRPMLRVDTDEIAGHVVELSGIATATVSRSWPGTIEITVTERTAVGYLNADGFRVVDDNGVVFKKVAEQPAGLPQIEVRNVGPDDPATKAVTAVLRSLPAQLRARTTVIGAATPGNVQFTLSDGKQIRWGDERDGQRKAAVLGALLGQQGHIYDVASPELPTISG